MEGRIAETYKKVVDSKKSQEDRHLERVNAAIEDILRKITTASANDKECIDFCRRSFDDEEAMKEIAKKFRVSAKEEESQLTGNIFIKYWTISW